MDRNHPLHDASVEAFFSDQVTEDDLAALSLFVEDVRNVAAGPVPTPSVQLAAMLSQGFSTASEGLPINPAGVPGPELRAAGSSWTRKKKMLVAELLTGLGVASKAMFGISLAAASVTAGGAAGVLPGPVQGAVAAAVEAATPFSLPDKADGKAEDKAEDETGDKAEDKAEDDFGAAASTDARDGGADGRAISEGAKLNGGENRPAEAGAEAGAGAGAGEIGPPAAPGQRGLDQAGTTPATGHAPTSVADGKPVTAGSGGPSTPGAGPAPQGARADAGTQSTNGLASAGSTPPAGRVPASAPPGQSADRA